MQGSPACDASAVSLKAPTQSVSAFRALTWTMPHNVTTGPPDEGPVMGLNPRPWGDACLPRAGAGGGLRAADGRGAGPEGQAGGAGAGARPAAGPGRAPGRGAPGAPGSMQWLVPLCGLLQPLIRGSVGRPRVCGVAGTSCVCWASVCCPCNSVWAQPPSGPPSGSGDEQGRDLTPSFHLDPDPRWWRRRWAGSCGRRRRSCRRASIPHPDHHAILNPQLDQG